MTTAKAGIELVQQFIALGKELAKKAYAANSGRINIS